MLKYSNKIKVSVEEELQKLNFTHRQKQTLLRTVYDTLFGLDLRIKNLETELSKGDKDLVILIRDLKEDLEDLRLSKDMLSAEVYKGVYN